jgi:uncharacterized protein
MLAGNKDNMKRNACIRIYILVLVICFVGALPYSFAGQESGSTQISETKWVPKLQDRVTDLAKVFSKECRRSLIETLARYEHKTTHQIVVLTIPSLRKESIESFSLRVANVWGIGHRRLDNGVLVILAISDRKVRIEVGRGLEHVIPNELAKEIIKTDMVPAFRKGEYAVGIETGVLSLMKAARRYVVPLEKRPK